MLISLLSYGVIRILHLQGVAQVFLILRQLGVLEGLLRLVLLLEHLRNLVLKLVLLGLHVLDCERYHGATDLDRHGVVGLQSQLVLEQDDGAELGGVVLNVEAVALALNDGVAATHTDVVDAHLAFMTATQLEFGLLVRYCQQVNVSRGVLVQRHRLQQNVVVASLRGDFVDKIDNLVDGFVDFEGVWVHLLADLAFEALPVERPNVLVLGAGRLFLFLGKHPGLQALEVDQAHRTLALTSEDQRVRGVLIVSPADSALDLVGRDSLDVSRALDLHCLSQLLLVQLGF